MNKIWKCLKYGRTFKNTNQDHYCGEAGPFGERSSHGAFRCPRDSPGGIQAKHGKSEILYAAPVEPCRGNGRHVQGDGMKSPAKSNDFTYLPH